MLKEFGAIKNPLSNISEQRAKVICSFIKALEANYEKKDVDSFQVKHRALLKTDLSQETFDKCMGLAKGFRESVADRPIPEHLKNLIGKNATSISDSQEARQEKSWH